MRTSESLIEVQSPSCRACKEADDTRPATEAELREMRRRIREGIVAHVKKISEIALSGGIATLIVDPVGVTRQAALAAGWDGVSNPAVFRMPKWAKQALTMTDTVSAAWVSNDCQNLTRIWVFFEDANLLLNHSPNLGFYFEPGSLDSDRV
jgi:hypothetical protein